MKFRECMVFSDGRFFFSGIRASTPNIVDSEDLDASVLDSPEIKVKRPSLYRVFLINDDYTPMDFVVWILEAFFNKNRDEAMRIMLQVHHEGVGECGIYPYEVAEMKVSLVMDCAQKNEHPLRCLMEKD